MSNRREAPPSIHGLYSLKVDNLSYSTSIHDLKRMFERYGDIGDVHIPRDRRTNQSRGFGFVRFYDRKDADHAIDRVDGRRVNGRELRVSMAKYDRPIDERARDRQRKNRSRSPRHRRSRTRSRSRSPRRSRTRSPPARSRSRSSTPKDSSPDKRNHSRLRSRSQSSRRSHSRSRSHSSRRSRSSTPRD